MVFDESILLTRIESLSLGVLTRLKRFLKNSALKRDLFLHQYLASVFDHI